jgi:hypothetical protein
MALAGDPSSMRKALQNRVNSTFSGDSRGVPPANGTFGPAGNTAKVAMANETPADDNKDDHDQYGEWDDSTNAGAA